MSNGDWEYPDVEGLIRARNENIDSNCVGSYEVPLGLPALGPEANLLSDPATYVFDPDYAELLGVEFHDLIKIRR